MMMMMEIVEEVDRRRKGYYYLIDHSGEMKALSSGDVVRVVDEVNVGIVMSVSSRDINP